jgi:hypothetical protein
MAIAAAEVGSPERVMQLATEGRLSKQALAQFLSVDKRPEFLDACAQIEKGYTEACTAAADPCLEGGCALEGEICLQPLVAHGLEYYQACGIAFTKLFADPRNRSGARDR